MGVSWGRCLGPIGPELSLPLIPLSLCGDTLLTNSTDTNIY